MPVVSVLMPAYNAGAYIGRAVESVLSQTLEDLELIIVDDNSSDNTWELAQSFAKQDPRVRILRMEENSGPAGATNRGVPLARAPLIAGMDADDIALPNRLERQVAVITAQPEIVVLGCFVSHVNQFDEVLSLSRVGPASVAEFQELRRRGETIVLLAGTIMCRRELFDRVGGFDATLRTAADLEFCDRMADHGAIVAIPEPLQLYRIYPTSNVMVRFWEGRQTHRYVAYRRAAKERGGPVPTRQQYVEIEQAASWWHRMRIRQDDVAQYLYRLAGISYAEGHIMGAMLRLAGAGLGRPIYVARRIWSQLLSADARSTRHT